MNITMKAVQILGAKRFKGAVEGQNFDSTKVYVVMDVSDSSGNEVGFNVSVMPYGKSDNFEQFKDQKFPVTADLEIKMTTKGAELVSVKLVPVHRAAA